MLVYMEGLVQIDKVLQVTRESERERQNQKKTYLYLALFEFHLQHHYFGKDLKQIL